MKVLLDIEDDKADFVMEWLHSLSFVKAEPLDIPTGPQKINLREIKVDDVVLPLKNRLAPMCYLKMKWFSLNIRN